MICELFAQLYTIVGDLASIHIALYRLHGRPAACLHEGKAVCAIALGIGRPEVTAIMGAYAINPDLLGV